MTSGTKRSTSTRRKPCIATWMGRCTRTPSRSDGNGCLHTGPARVGEKHGERKRLWNRNAMCDDYQTLVWDCFSVRDVQATAYLDRSIYKAVVDHWPEAARVVKNGPQQRAEAKTGQQSKGKGHGKKKGKVFDTKQGEFLSRSSWQKVTDGQYNREVRARQEEADQADL